MKLLRCFAQREHCVELTRLSQPVVRQVGGTDDDIGVRFACKKVSFPVKVRIKRYLNRQPTFHLSLLTQKCFQCLRLCKSLIEPGQETDLTTCGGPLEEVEHRIET